MRPTAITWTVVGVIVALTSIALTALVFVERDDARPWFYWFAPIFVVQVALLLVALAAGYYWRVVRPEVKGRPRQ